LIRYLCDETNETQKAEVENWISQSEANHTEFERMKKMLAVADISFQTQKYDSVAAWNNVKSEIETSEDPVIHQVNSRNKLFVQFYKYAAVIVFALLAGTAAFYFGRQDSAVQLTEVNATDKQVINEITLPDGSKVALNSNSKLFYPTEFTGETREVSIEGEAFFDVEHNPEKPFVINAGNAQVKVLGTSFNVCAYPETETIEVVVTTGKVQVSARNEMQNENIDEVFLSPGEKGTLYNSTRILEKSENSNPNYMAWKTHDFVFENIALGEVIACLEKTYHVTINVEENQLNDLVLNARFDKKSIDFILNVVKLTFDLELSSDDEHYTFSSRKNN
jgi:ferric-dicitrate binding protein FerR (iron transport regulator)